MLQKFMLAIFFFTFFSAKLFCKKFPILFAKCIQHVFTKLFLKLFFMLSIFEHFSSYFFQVLQVIFAIYSWAQNSHLNCKTYNLTRKLGFSYVSAGDSFPLTTKKGFSLRAGFENRVAIRAVDIETEPQTRVPSMSFYPDFMQILS